jgi:hypothetical protein
MSETLEKKAPRMMPIWYFVGWMLFLIGLMVVASGVVNLISPPQQKTVLYHLHTNLWWGAVITLFGLIMLYLCRKAPAG